MSVHGEYSRALENLLARVRVLSRTERDSWLQALEAARIDRHPDLTSAAETCREILESIADSLALSAPQPDSADAEWLREAYEHLVAHCQAVLGGRGERGPDR